MGYAKGNICHPPGDRGGLWGHFLTGSFRATQSEGSFLVLPHGYAGKRHLHPQGMEITIVLEGSLTQEVDGQIVVLKQFDYLIIPAMARSRTVEVGDSGAKLLVIKAPSIAKDKIVIE